MNLSFVQIRTSQNPRGNTASNIGGLNWNLILKDLTSAYFIGAIIASPSCFLLMLA